MINHKKRFMSGISLFLLSIILGFAYPHSQPFAAFVFDWIGIPRYSNMDTETGLHYPGILLIVLFLGSLILMNHALDKHHFKVIGLAFVVGVTGTSLLADGFQKYFATGVYAIAYERDHSQCTFNMPDEERSTLYGECKIPLVNHSDKDLTFDLAFLERHRHHDGMRMESLMNMNGPHTLTLSANKTKIFNVKAAIDISKLNEGEYPFDGQSTGVEIQLTDGVKHRKYTSN